MQFADLEKAVDDHGLYAITMALAEICDFKASHITEAWQDEPLARHWQAAAHTLAQACEKFKHGVRAGHVNDEIPGTRG